jgi:hypothetical protein
MHVGVCARMCVWMHVRPSTLIMCACMCAHMCDYVCTCLHACSTASASCGSALCSECLCLRCCSVQRMPVPALLLCAVNAYACAAALCSECLRLRCCCPMQVIQMPHLSFLCEPGATLCPHLRCCCPMQVIQTPDLFFLCEPGDRLCPEQSKALAALLGQPSAAGGRWQLEMAGLQDFAVLLDLDGNSWSSRWASQGVKVETQPVVVGR